MLNKTKPMLLGDIFSNTFSLAGKTFSRNIILSAIFFIPTGILMAKGFQMLFSYLAELAKLSETRHEYNTFDFSYLFGSIFFYSTAILLFSLGSLCANIGITKITSDQINDVRTSISDTFRVIFSMKLLKAFGQSFLLILAIVAIVAAAILIMVILSLTHSILLTLAGVVLIIASGLFALYLYFKWYFAFPSIIIDEMGVMESFSKSSLLVSGYWWRTFGIVLLISIVIQFAISIISTPISFIFMWDFISASLMMSAHPENPPDPSLIFEMMKSLGFSIGIIMILTSILEVLIMPVFRVIMYYDLKIRKNDFPIEPLVDPGITIIEPAVE